MDVTTSHALFMPEGKPSVKFQPAGKRNTMYKTTKMVGAISALLMAMTTANAALIHEPDGRIAVMNAAREDHLFEIPCAGMGGENKIYHIEATLETGVNPGSIRMAVGRWDVPALAWLYTGGDTLQRVAAGSLPADAALSQGTAKVVIRLYATLKNTMRVEQSVTTASGTVREVATVPIGGQAFPSVNEDSETFYASWSTLKIHLAGSAAIRVSYRAFHQPSLFLVK